MSPARAAESAARGAVKSTRVAEGRHRDSRRQKRHNLEQFAHLVGSGEAIDIGGNFFVHSRIARLSEAAGALQKDIESTHWVEEHEEEAKASGAHDRHVEASRAAGKKRVVYLGRG